MTPAIRELEVYLPRSELNVTYIPITVSPGRLVSPEWLLEHYDYARARALLRTLGGDHLRGPYLVSSQKAPVPTKPVTDCLYQDLSTIPPRLAGDWMREFLRQAAQWGISKQPKLETLGLWMRTIIAVAGSGIDPVLHGIDHLIRCLPARA